MNRAVYLLCYDIAHPRRLGRVYRTTSKTATPLQYSVFYLVGNNEILNALLDELTAIIDEDKDDIRVYRISSQAAITTLGQAFIPDEIHLV